MRIYCVLYILICITAFAQDGSHIPVLLCKQDHFGNLHITIVPNKAEVSDLTKQLKRVIKKQKKSYANKTFILHVAHEHGCFNLSAKQAGFTMHYANDNDTEWIYRNGSPIPNPSTAIASASVFICRMHEGKQQVLLLKDKDKYHLGLPGGSIDAHEFALNAATREVKEETQLIIEPHNLALVALIEEPHNAFYDRTQYRFFFKASHYAGTVKIDPKEQEFYLWVPVEQLMTGLRVEGYEVEKIIFKLLPLALSSRTMLHPETIFKKDLSYNKLTTVDTLTLWSI